MSRSEIATGQQIITFAGVQRRRHLLGWPGWEAPNYRDFLGEIPAGLHGTITGAAQHNSAPYTRYSVRFDDGTTAHELAAHRDFSLVLTGEN